MIQLQCASFGTLFVMEISSHSHIKRKQPQKIFLQYSCSLIMINIVKKYLWKKIHDLNNLSWSSFDSQRQAQNRYIVESRLVQNNYWWLLRLFRYVLHTKLPFCEKLTPYPHIFFHLKSFLWKGPLTAKVRKNINDPSTKLNHIFIM